MNSRKWDMGDVAIAVMVAITALLAFKKLGGVEWAPHLAMLPFGKITGLLLVGAVCFFWFCAEAHTKKTADLAGSLGTQLLALAALVTLVGILLTKVSGVFNELQTILKV